MKLSRICGGLLCMMMAGYAAAVVIEGTTPSGKFKTVGLSEAGRFLIEQSTGVVTHVIVDSGFITARASTTTIVVSQSFTATGTAGICYPADASRQQGVLCNSDATLDLYVGSASLTPPGQTKLLPGSCLSPDDPSSYTGALYCASTASTSGYYIYFK